METINLIDFRGNNSYTFTGKPEGKAARVRCNLDTLDDTNELVEVIVPSNTRSINPSFFLGLFYKSIKKLTEPKFREKYVFKIESDDEEIKNILIDNIEEGIRYAISFIERKGGLKKFL